jgi:hypothetical protein
LIMDLAQVMRRLFKKYENASPKPERYQAAEKLLSELKLSLVPTEENPKNICINNLRQIDGAKEQWALENKKSKGEVPAGRELWGLTTGYLKRELHCPTGGVYDMRGVDEPPVCSIHGGP